jgi:hypothetical protein
MPIGILLTIDTARRLNYLLPHRTRAIRMRGLLHVLARGFATAAARLTDVPLR